MKLRMLAGSLALTLAVSPVMAATEPPMMMIDGPGAIPCQTFQKEKPANAALIGWLAGYARGLIVAGAAFSGKSLVEAYEMSHIPLAHLINSIELYCTQHLQDNLEGAVLDFAAGPRKD